MEHFRRDEVAGNPIPGRVVQRAIGRDGRSPSELLSVGFARFSAAAGVMEPHRHGEEAIYVLDARDGWIEWGPAADELDERCDLEAGMVLHIRPDEWHVFRHADGGFIDILFVFSPPIW
jgi:hypothetical protein